MAAVFGSAKRKIDRSDFLWLAYLIFFVIEPVQRHSLRYWSECLVIMALFLVLYIRFLRSDTSREKVLLISAMAGLGAVSTPFNGGGIAFLIYSCALVPYAIVETSYVLAFVALNILIIGVEGTLLHFGIFSIFLNVFFAIVVASTNVIFAQKERNDCKVRLKQEEIESLAAVAERERIARDLHDVLGHTLSVIVLKSELAGRLVERECETLAASNSGCSPGILRARAELTDVERTARTALAEVREAITGYRSRGLSAEIDAARSTLAAAGVDLLLEANLGTTGLSAGEETILALALREAVTNIVRHARATECRLALVHAENRYHLSIQDNGHHPAIREGNGLRGMRERVESLGGRLSLNHEAGTRVFIDIPLRAG